MPREFTRSTRIAAQIQREMAELLRTEVEAPELGMITVSDVEVTRDMAHATVYVTFLGCRLEQKAALKRLKEFAPHLRQLLSRQIRMRVMPELRFAYDDSLERGIHMDALLRSLRESSSSQDQDSQQ